MTTVSTGAVGIIGLLIVGHRRTDDQEAQFFFAVAMSDQSIAEQTGASPQSGKMLTVVIPHFNQKKFLPRAVASVLNGETSDIEIIVVDDGSTDDSKPILEALEKYDQRVKIIRCRENRGAPIALNTGLAAARGRYVSFLGADDFVMPTLYGPLLRELENNKSAALACSEIAILGTDDCLRGIRPMTPPAFRTTHLKPDTVVRRSENTDNWICNTSTVYRTKMVQAAGGFDPSLGSFCDGFLSRVLAFEHGFIFVPGGPSRMAGRSKHALRFYSARPIQNPESCRTGSRTARDINCWSPRPEISGSVRVALAIQCGSDAVRMERTIYRPGRRRCDRWRHRHRSQGAIDHSSQCWLWRGRPRPGSRLAVRPFAADRFTLTHPSRTAPPAIARSESPINPEVAKKTGDRTKSIIEWYRRQCPF